MNRRSFVTGVSAGIPAIYLSSSISKLNTTRKKLIRATREYHTDIVIAGSGLGGCAAALAALRNGLSVIMTEETDWIGGQMTQQAVPPDEHQWIESFGCTRAYRALRDGIREYYRAHYPLTTEARNNPTLNPGQGNVSRLCHEPRVALAVLQSRLAPYLSTKQLILLLEHKATAAEVDKDRVFSLAVRNLRTGNELVLSSSYFIDATELGDLLPKTGTEYVTGFESRKDTGELHAPETARPADMQSFTYCFAMDYLEGENYTIDQPEDYKFWRDYIPKLTQHCPGKQVAWPYTEPISLKPVTNRICDPVRESEDAYSGFWLYRRIAYKKHHQPGFYRSDITLVNWPHNDYMLGNLIDVPEAEMRKHLRGGKQLSLSYLYWMQTEAPRPDGGAGWPGLRLRGDIVGTEDGLAKYPYIRESRRIKAEFTVVEQHVGTDARMKATGKSREEVTAEAFPDSVGVGSYRIDLHPSSGGDNYIDISSLPFQIPLGALIPQCMENLLPACKNLGVTHITNGCFRLHPVEWNIGESAGMLAVYCLKHQEKPRGVRNTQKNLREFQDLLRAQGIELDWPRVTPR